MLIRHLKFGALFIAATALAGVAASPAVATNPQKNACAAFKAAYPDAYAVQFKKDSDCKRFLQIRACTPPDRDSDRVPDASDRCPDVAGPYEGCLRVVDYSVHNSPALVHAYACANSPTDPGIAGSYILDPLGHTGYFYCGVLYPEYVGTPFEPVAQTPCISPRLTPTHTSISTTS